MKKKYQVFISSTYTDLKNERMAVTQCLLDNNCIPVGMEQFPASNMKQMDYIAKMLDDCDYYILILAGRYGSIDAEDGIGFTEKEYNYAKGKGIPIMSFVVDDMGKLPNGVCEQDDAGKKRLNAFREKVCSDKMVKFYSNVDDLRVKVITSIHRCIDDFPAVGWVRGDEVPPTESLETKFEELLAKHMATEEDIKALFQEVKNKPNIHYGKEPPKELKDGDLWVQIVDDE